MLRSKISSSRRFISSAALPVFRAFSRRCRSWESSRHPVLWASSAWRTRSPVPDPMLSRRRSLATSTARRFTAISFTFTCISRSESCVRLSSTACSISYSLLVRWSASCASSVSTVRRSRRMRGVPSSTLSPSRQKSSTRRESTGELMTCSKPGATRPEALTVVSTWPRSTLPKRKAPIFTDGCTSDMAPTTHATSATAGMQIFTMRRMRMRRRSACGISLSIIFMFFQDWIVMPFIYARSVPKM